MSKTRFKTLNMLSLHDIITSDTRNGAFFMKNNYFTRDISGAIKGIALMLMFVHHFFTFPEWIICGIDYAWIRTFADQFAAPTKLCVALFAFFTGYFHVFSAGTLRRSVRKIVDFLLSYWLVCAVLIGAALAMGCYTLSKAGLVFELLGLQTTVMVFCWYVGFFCVIQIMLPLLCRQSSTSPVRDVLAILVLPLLCLCILAEQEFEPILSALILNMQKWYPCAAVGCLFGKYDLFQKWLEPILDHTNRPASQKMLLSALLVWLAFRGCYYIDQLNLGSIRFRSYDCPIVFPTTAIYAPIFLFGAANLLTRFRGSLGVRVLEKIGEHSMLMWFYHCFFFGNCGKVTQLLLYWPRNPVLVFLNGLLMCYLAAALTEPVRKMVIQVKDRLISRISGMIPAK